MQFTFEKAIKKKLKARVAIDGPSGSGKTYTSLIAATALAQGGKIAVIDTERGSASLYSDKFDFDVLELETFSPALYTQAIKAAEKAGYAVIVIDSLSHAWEGEGGALDMADAATARMRSQNSYVAWREVTPVHREMVDAMLQSPAHIVATMRSKMEYVMEKDERTGKTTVNKVGLAPIQRSGMEYEFTLVADMDLSNRLIVSKSRYEPYTGKTQIKPGIDFFQPFAEWLARGEDGSKTVKAAKPSTTQREPANPSLAAAGWSDPLWDGSHEGGESPEPGVPMTIEDAYKVTGTKGNYYHKETTAALQNIAAALRKRIDKNGLSDEDKASEQYKLDAALLILQDRAAGSIN